MMPPRVPRTILRRAAPPQDRAALIGDLDEEFRARMASPADARGAVAWYWRQAIASVPSALRMRWQRAAPAAGIGGDVRRAVRTLRRQPAFAFAAIATMALGSGVTTAVVSIAEAILVRPLPYANADRVLVIEEHDLTRRGRGFSWPDFADSSARLQTFSALAAYNGGSRTLTGLGAAERLSAVDVTPRFFEVLGVTPAMGRDFQESDAGAGAPRVVILTDRAWRARLGADPEVVGRTITLNGEAHTVVGVLPRAFVFPPRADPDLWLPLRPSRAQQDRAYLHFLDVIGLRRPDVPVAAVAEDLRAQAQAWQHSGQPWHAGTLLDARGLRADMVAGVRPALFVLLGAALLVLLASAVNVSGLVLARAAARTREVAVRSALGASRWRIARQFAVEALCIAVAGSLLGLVLASWAVAVFGATTPERFRASLPYGGQIAVSFAAAVFSVGATMAAALTAAVLPAFRAARATNPLHMGSRSTASAGETRLRRILVAGQMALAVVLLAGAALLGRSVLNLARVSPGFDIDRLVAGRVSLPGGRYGSREAIVTATERLLDSVRAIPGVEGAEAINQLPLTGRGNTGDFSIVGRLQTPSSDPLIRDVTPGYFRLMGVPLLEGRGFRSSDTREAPRVVVINRTLARLVFNDRPPLGQRIVFAFFEGRPEWTIVGVSGDEQFDALDRPMAPVVYFPFSQDPGGSLSIVLRARDTAAVTPAFRAAVAAVDPELPLYGVQTLARTAADSNAMFLRGMVTRLLAWFAFAALLLAGVGVYGVLAETIAARTKEIGLRLALGATPRGIARLVVLAGATPAFAGLAGGIALAALAAPALRSLLFGVTLLDPVSAAAVVAALGAVTLLACAVPAWRAVRLPLTTALRAE